MDPYLTLAIAVGGIATGIGAIWTAILARRQLSEQRQFIEQQNERARISLQEELMNRLWQQWMSPAYEGARLKSIRLMEEYLLVDGGLAEPERVDAPTNSVLDFFDQLGYLTKIGVLGVERVLGTYERSVRLGWGLYEPAVRKERKERAEPVLHADFEYLYHQALDFDAKRGGTGGPPTKEELRNWVESLQKDSADLKSEI